MICTHSLKRTTTPGFSVMELMIYLAIVGMILAVSITGFMSFQENARRKTTTQLIQTTKQAIMLYYTELGKYPTRLEDLVEKPKSETSKKWYPFLEKLPKDAWSHELVYRVTPGGKRPYELYSTGGLEEGEEDPEKQISVWD